MIIDVDAASPTPAFEQVRAQLAGMIRAGALPAGYRLAPIRQLAADLALAPGTIARVYRELEAEGLVVSRVRHGTVVADVPRPPKEDRERALASLARRYAAQSRQLGASLDQATAALAEQWLE